MSSIPNPTKKGPGGQRVFLNPRPLPGSFGWEMDHISDYGGRGAMEIIVSQEKLIPILKGTKFLNSCRYDHNFKVEI